MPNRIDIDVARFKHKLESYKRDAVKKYFQTDYIGRISPDGNVLQIPIPILRIPRFRFEERQMGGVGMGDGEEGDIIATPFDSDQSHNDNNEQQNQDDLESIVRPGGYNTGEDYDPYKHSYVDANKSEVAQALQEELHLPNLRETFGSQTLEISRRRYTGIRKVGSQSLVHFRRTYRSALKRMIASGEYDRDKPSIIPRREDQRFKAVAETKGSMNAVIIYLLDCSGSMLGTLDFLQEVAWLAESWIEHHYPTTVQKYVHYDSVARESTRKEFYSISAGGENNMGIGYLRVSQLLDQYPLEQYNRFVIHLTDGDYFGLQVTEQDVQRYTESMREYPSDFPPMSLALGNPLLDRILPKVNALFVCEAGAYYGDKYMGGRYGRMSDNNYSVLLSQLIRQNPSFAPKVRCVSFKDYTISSERSRCRLETLQQWFSAAG